MQKKEKKLFHTIVILVGIFLLVSVDYLTKQWISVYFKEQNGLPFVVIPKILQISYVENRGIAWGMFQGKQMFFFVMGLAVLVLASCYYRRIPWKKRYIPMHLFFMLFAAGAVGNMIDRAFYGYVIDFFEVLFIQFPVFNVADIYVTTAAGIFIFFGFFFYKDEELTLLFTKRKAEKE